MLATPSLLLTFFCFLGSDHWMACLNYNWEFQGIIPNLILIDTKIWEGRGDEKHGLADFHFRALSSQLSSIVFNSNLRKMADNQRIRAPTRIYVVIIVGFRSRPTTHHCLVPTQPPPRWVLSGEISSDLYCLLQCDIEKCGFDSLKVEQNRWNCD